MHNSSFRRTIFVLALPVALQSLLQAFLGMADVAMVSGLGGNAVAAVGLAAKLQFLLLVLMFGVASACGILIAHYKGAGNDEACRRVLAIALVVGAVLVLPFVVMFAVSRWWLPWINPDADVVRLATQYLMITAPILFMVQTILTFEAALRSVGQTMASLFFGAFGVLLNILLNYILIFGKLGFPAMGVAGAAWATLISRALQMLAYLLWIYWQQHTFALCWRTIWRAMHLQEVRRVVVFALPLVINHGIWGLGNTTYHIATGYAGTDALAVMGIMVPIESAFFSLFIGLANASSVMVGQSLGANQADEAWRLYKKCVHLALILAISLSLLLWLLRDTLFVFFADINEHTRQLLDGVVTVFCCVVWIKVLNMIRVVGVLRAGGDNHFCLATDIVVMWVLGLPLFLGGIALGLPFVVLFALMFLEEIFKFFPLRWRINQRIWIRNLTTSRV